MQGRDGVPRRRATARQRRSLVAALAIVALALCGALLSAGASAVDENGCPRPTGSPDGGMVETQPEEKGPSCTETDQAGQEPAKPSEPGKSPDSASQPPPEGGGSSAGSPPPQGQDAGPVPGPAAPTRDGDLRAPESERGLREIGGVRKDGRADRRSSKTRRREARLRRLRRKRARKGAGASAFFRARGFLAPLPDPLPAGKRLDPRFARQLASAARRRGVSWALVLAVLRARGKQGSAPASAAELHALARQLARAGAGRSAHGAAMALSLRDLRSFRLGSGEAGFGDRVIALADYHQAVGLDGLVRGLHAVKSQLIARVLGNPHLSIYPGGRADVAAGAIDVRVLVLLLYLAERYDQVGVTSLMSGHGFFTKSGSVSLHSSGRAVDIVSLGGVPILGNQEPGGLTEGALRAILQLPPELQPSELISLFSVGGPTLAMPDHADHIHVGF